MNKAEAAQQTNADTNDEKSDNVVNAKSSDIYIHIYIYII